MLSIILLAKPQECWLARILPIFHVIRNAANQGQGIEQTLAQDTLNTEAMMRWKWWRVKVSSQWSTLQHSCHSQSPLTLLQWNILMTRSTVFLRRVNGHIYDVKGINQNCTLYILVCLPWCWAERLKKASKNGLTAANWTPKYQAAYLSRKHTSMRKNIPTSINISTTLYYINIHCINIRSIRYTINSVSKHAVSTNISIYPHIINLHIDLCCTNPCPTIDINHH